MESRIGSAHESEIPKKSRSLDLKSLYLSSKRSEETRLKKLKRKSGNDVDNSGTEKKKKSREAVSVSSFRKVNGNGSKSLEELYNGSLKSGSHETKDSKRKVSNSGTGFSLVAFQNLEGGFGKIPRRKRGFVGRKRVEKDSRVSKSVEGSANVVENGDQACDVTDGGTGKVVQSSKVKQKKVPDDFRGNRNGETSSGFHCEEEDEYTDHSGRSVVVSLWRSHNSPSFENVDDSLKKASHRKRSRKRKDFMPKGVNRAKESEPSIGANVKLSVDDFHDDDEENLEENAARMLSSRFDTCHTGFSSNSKTSPTPSANDLSFLLSSDREFTAHGRNYMSGSESASLDAAARVLRPRKQHKEKGSSRKRRHYYEIFSGDLDAYWVLNRRIKVFWPLDQSWYYGLVSDYDDRRKLHHVKYDDRDEEWISLQDERFKLLLLPSEVPGKARRKRSRTKEKFTDGEKRNLKPKKEKKELTTEAGNFMDSEPIISWLARSTHKVKSSPLRALKKRKTSDLSLSSVPQLVPEKAASNECSDIGSLSKDKCTISGNPAVPERLIAGGRSDESHAKMPISPKHNKFPIVYYRRRFRNASTAPHHTSESNHVAVGASELDTSVGPTAAVSRAFEKQEIIPRRMNPDSASKRFDNAKSLWLSDVKGFLKLNADLVKARNFKFELRIPVLSVFKYSFGVDHTWLCNAFVLLHCGMLMTVWPRVRLEMLFVDNIVGLRFMLYEGGLKQAIAFVFRVLAVFHQPTTKPGKFDDLQLPVTSIKFKFSFMQDLRKHLVFAFYNFSQLNNSRWINLDSSFERQCLLTKHLPLSECTYDNVKALQNGTGPLLSVYRDSPRVKGQVKRFKQCVKLLSISRDSNHVNIPSSSNFEKSHGWLPPFALSFTAAPTFFLGLHLKLLIEHSVAHISFQEHNSVEYPELADDCCSVEDTSNKHPESTRDNSSKASSEDADCNECITCAQREPQVAVVSDSTVGDRMKHSPEQQKGVLHAENSSFSNDTGELGRDDTTSLEKWQTNLSELEDISPKPSGHRDKCSTSSPSLLDGIRVEIPSSNQFDNRVDDELHGPQQSADLAWNMNSGIIPSPNPTARRSTWHRNRCSTSSFGYSANGWSDGRVDFLQNNFGNGPKKPRTQVSYALPFGGSDYGSKTKSHSQKGISHKRIRTANEKRSSDLTRGLERNLDEFSCEANVLITLSDKGWRECGAHVVLELFDHNEWKLAVKLSGTTKYSYKAHQFLQPGSTNRYTHAMMWKGGKDWILEFPDRSQWALFKEMHEECYNRNILAASFKNIPIPGVRLIEEHDDNGIEVPFVRPSSKYFRQIETDVEMALDPLRVLYDIDSDDEQWISKNLASLEVASSSSCTAKRSQEIFEKTMDMFEKAAYTQQRDQFTSDEIEELMGGVGSMKAIEIIYNYWQQKRQRMGMPLIRHLQPPLWERYQQQVKEWELKMTKSRTALSNGCHEKTEKPPMFAFCLKPRGLELPSSRGSKHRAQRKISVTGHRTGFSGDHDSFHAYGRRLNEFASGDEKVYQGHSYELFDDSLLPQTSPRVFSPRDSGGKGYFLMCSDGYERNRIHRRKARKPGAYIVPNNSQMVASYDEQIFDKRNGFQRWSTGLSEWPGQHHYYLDGPTSHGSKQFDTSDFDDFRLLDASGAAQHARNMAKLKREKAQRLLYRADLAIHKAVVALMTAEAIKVSSEDMNSDG